MRLGARRGRGRWPFACLAIATVLGLPQPLRADPPEPAPRDPNDAVPRMRAPYGQSQSQERRWDPAWASSRSSRRRLQLTVLPTYAVVRLPFIGRPTAPLHGGGAALEIDVHLWRPLWLRAQGSYSAHPLRDVYESREEEIVRTAAGGRLDIGDAGLSIVYALDLGRLVPLLDVGLGAMWIATPAGVQEGQLGQACQAAGVCDTGLTCDTDNVCRVATTFELHAGLAVDAYLGDHVSLGAAVRYFALLSAPGNYPIYLLASARLGVRF